LSKNSLNYGQISALTGKIAVCISEKIGFGGGAPLRCGHIIYDFIFSSIHHNLGVFKVKVGCCSPEILKIITKLSVTNDELPL